MQTGSLAQSLNISVQAFALAEPVPDPVDPTGGVRANNETGSRTLPIVLIQTAYGNAIYVKFRNIIINSSFDFTNHLTACRI